MLQEQRDLLQTSGGCCPISVNAVCCRDGEHCCPTDQPVCCVTVCCPSGTTCCSGNKCCSKRNSLQSPVENLLSSQAARKLLNSVQFPKTLYMQNVQLTGPCNSYEVEMINKGYHKCVYLDPKKIPTIGVGLTLRKMVHKHKSKVLELITMLCSMEVSA